jgi:hypothetical protein
LLAEQTADQLDPSPRRPAALVQKRIKFVKAISPFGRFADITGLPPY